MIEQCQQISRQRGERNVFAMLLDQIAYSTNDTLKHPKTALGVMLLPFGISKSLHLQGAIEIGSAIDNFAHEVSISNPMLSSEALANLEVGLEAMRELKPGQAWSKDIQNLLIKN